MIFNFKSDVITEMQLYWYSSGTHPPFCGSVILHVMPNFTEDLGIVPYIKQFVRQRNQK
jgi:hypothetical protein